MTLNVADAAEDAPANPAAGREDHEHDEDEGEHGHADDEDDPPLGEVVVSAAAAN